MEVVLRNVLAEQLAARHAAMGRAGTWLDDPAGELDQRARADIREARRRVVAKGKQPADGQTISELSFGFWRFMLARRYNTVLWPSLAGGFPYAPDRARTTIDAPVTRLHLFRNRLAHHERIWTEPLTARYEDILGLLHHVEPRIVEWVRQECRVPLLLNSCPIARPHP
ncbi:MULTISPECIES: hypothetical protein [Micromonospora]|uniref:hypothetical protein n=1 Tax=Micromonospora TaxID=1873 RepID=UPI0011AEE7B8|nr:MULTISPECIES: hypothetical protein [Micromonospora]